MNHRLFKTIGFFGITLVAFLISNVTRAADQNGILFIKETCLFFCKDSTGTTIGRKNVTMLKAPANAAVEFHVDSSGLFVMSANQARQARGEAPLPAPPQVVHVGFGKSWLIGDFTEVAAHTGILVGSLHVLQGLNPEYLKAALDRNAQFAHKPYRLIQPILNGSPLDIIFIVVGATDNAIATSRVRDLIQTGAFASSVVPRERYFSYQIGDQNRESFNQTSVGFIGRVSLDGRQALISTGGENYTAPGSSGSVVFVQAGRLPWSIGGVVECGIPKSGATQPYNFAAIRLITSLAIRQSELVPLPQQDLSHETERINPSCIPLDGKAGGG